MPMQTTVEAVHKKVSQTEAQGLVLFTRPGRPLPKWLRNEEPEITGTLATLVEEGEITGKNGNRVILHRLDKGFRRVIVLGIGEDQGLANLQKQYADMVRDVREKGLTRFAIVLPDYLYPEVAPERIAKALAEASPIACYVYHKFMATPDPKVNLEVELITRTKKESASVNQAIHRGLAIGKAVTFSRDLCNMPANVATPEYVADIAGQIAAKSEGLLELQVLDKKQMEAEGMNLILAVSAGSALEPRLICLDYRGDPKSKKRVALVGKCITFDSGGISIKPSKGMMEMKRDKMGGTNVLGLASVMRYLKPKMNVSFVVPAAENMPSDQAYRPGDCYQAMNGKWVEIISTDAEGRLVLGDALTWVQKYRKPQVILDMATLTGGAELALGGGMIATFANDESLWKLLSEASRLSGEEIWRLPLYQPYKKGVRSYFAQTKNSSTTPPSTIKAALFLEEWIESGVKWGHLDIAAQMSTNKPSGLETRGASATGLRLAADLLALLEAQGA